MEQRSLNVIETKIENTTYPKDYYSLLGSVEQSNDEEKKNWQTIENIKEVKEGYFTQAIYIISQMKEI
ncbi:MAG: hypothetical protein ACTTJH_01265 [Bacteroidales bacterium]